MFDHTRFFEEVTQFRDFADGYEALGVSTDEALGWANHGFMPDEAALWLAEGHTPERAAFWANKYTVSPAEARAKDGR